MVKIYSSFFAVCLSGMALAQIPNASFESWNNGDPVGWMTSNAASPSVSQSGDAYAGSSAARMQSFAIGELTFGATLISEEFPQTTMETAIRGWYKGTFVNGDNLLVAAFIADASDVQLQGGVGNVLNSTSVYTQFSIPMETNAAGTPDYAVVSLLIYGPAGSFIGTDPNTFVFVDDLSWGATVSVEEIEATGTVLESVYPNPTNGNPALVQFNMARPGHALIEVFDLTGKRTMTVLNQVMPTGHYRAEMNTSGLSSGVYMCRLIVDGTPVQTLRFVN